MNDWIEYYDSTHTIYVSKKHRDIHFAEIARDIIDYIPTPQATVVDYACGEALSARDVANACGKLVLAEPAPSVRARLVQRFATDPKIDVSSLADLATVEAGSVDLVVMNSVAQYMTPAELQSAFAMIARLLNPGGAFVVGDILHPNIGAIPDAFALLRLAARHGFLIHAVTGLVRTALSDYRRIRTRVGLQTYSESDMLQKLAVAGFTASPAPHNIGHNPWRTTFVARPTPTSR